MLDIRNLSFHTQNVERKSIYVESTIPSYLTAKTSSNFLNAAHQSITRQVWDNEMYKYDLFISDYVIEDCEKGDSDAAKRRLDCIANITLLQKTPEIESLALIYQDLLGVPDKAKEDCFHLAACVVERIDYLLTWNCRHLG
ncbi:MAG: type II toxin-antitoxin system VapC family toxin, partial [Spirochaetaceae bacterium]|nr:type II toxin-antitoxin system VapC family toxin [Spirochaetaceae bacterium]